MKKSFCLFLFTLIIMQGYSQNDEIIKARMINLATLVVDYTTHEFEGGHMAYYLCPNCIQDSLPIIIDYSDPGDFGGITLKLNPSDDTIFSATIIWMGLGEISYPDTFHNVSPFINSDTLTIMPNDMKYLFVGNWLKKSVIDSAGADSAWQAIDSLRITYEFSKHNYRALAYLYPPQVGFFNPLKAKWIFFLYYADKTINIAEKLNTKCGLSLFPNPTKGIINFSSNFSYSEPLFFKLYNDCGAIVEEGSLMNNQIDIVNQRRGIYFLQIMNKKGKIIYNNKVLKL